MAGYNGSFQCRQLLVSRMATEYSHNAFLFVVRLWRITVQSLIFVHYKYRSFRSSFYIYQNMNHLLYCTCIEHIYILYIEYWQVYYMYVCQASTVYLKHLYTCIYIKYFFFNLYVICFIFKYNFCYFELWGFLHVL